jgi:hypothetical protein
MSAGYDSATVWMVAAPGVRRTLTPPGDIRADVDFQNDINRLLARIEESKMPWRPAAEMCTYAVGPLPEGYHSRNSVKPLLRVFDGGRMSLPTRQRRDAGAGGQAGYAATAPATAVPSFSRR